jgi:NAD(P)H-quinone oxidoreductase subunit 2
MSTDFMEPLKAFIQNNNIELIGPELLLTIVIMVCVWHLSFSKTREERQDTWRIAVSGTVLTFIFLLVLWWTRYFENPAFQSVSVFKSAFGDGMFKADLFSLLIRTLLTLGTILVLFFTRNFIDKRADVPGEFYVIMLSALLGGMMLSGSTDLIMVFVSLETLSISSYILAGYMRGNILSAEAGLKYLLYGGMATAILLFGLSILYGFTGSTGFSEIAAAMPAYSTNPIVWSIMAIMIVGGICFKLSAAPFHMWAPDTYEGAPTFGMQEGWMGLISVLAVVSMVIGNVVALAQSNIKRLLAYSTVAHVGYLLLGLVVMTQAGLASLVYYLITYLFMNLGAFAVVTHFEDLTGRSDIAAYAGLMRKKPGLAFILSIMLLSLAGIPITAGFFGKFFLFQAVANAGSQYLWLVVVALLTSTISLYYYLNVIRLMVIAEPSEAVESLPVPASHSAKFSPVGLTMAVCLIGTIALGILADSFMQVSMSAVRGMSKPETYAVQPVQKPEISKAH